MLNIINRTLDLLTSQHLREVAPHDFDDIMDRKHHEFYRAVKQRHAVSTLLLIINVAVVITVFVHTFLPFLQNSTHIGLSIFSVTIATIGINICRQNKKYYDQVDKLFRLFKKAFPEKLEPKFLIQNDVYDRLPTFV